MMGVLCMTTVIPAKAGIQRGWATGGARDLTVKRSSVRLCPPFALRRGREQAQRCERGMLGEVRGAGCCGRGRSHPLRVHPLRNSLRSFASPSQSEGEDFSAASVRSSHFLNCHRPAIVRKWYVGVFYWGWLNR